MIQRAILAAKATGLQVVRIVARADGYSIETCHAPQVLAAAGEAEAKPAGPEIIL
jgi:putative intracellular protease/amidase